MKVSRLVRRGAKGFSTPKIDGKQSLRASTTGMLVMEDVRLPASAMLPGVKGMSGPFSCLNSYSFLPLYAYKLAMYRNHQQKCKNLNFGPE